MDIFIAYILPAAISGIIGIAAFLLQSIYKRLDELENKIDAAITNADARALLADKIDPIKEDVTEIKQAIAKFYSLYLTGKI